MSQALPLVAYPDLEGRVKAMEEDGFPMLYRRLSKANNLRNFVTRWIG